MATSGKAFAISLAIYTVTISSIFLLFSLLRIWRVTRKFYAPREALSQNKTNPGEVGGTRREGLPPPPPPLGSSFLGWIPGVLRIRESQLLRHAGVDGTLYLKFLRLGMEIFTLVSLVVLVIALPINLTSGYLSSLMPPDSGDISPFEFKPSDVSEYTFWVPPPSTITNNGTRNTTDKPEVIQPPPIYNDSIPDPPPGIIWWEYLPDVPLLPDITTALGPDFERYGWRYDDEWIIIRYSFTDLDKTTMANMPARSSRLYAHAVLAWVVTAIALWRIWAMCRTALRLRQYHLLTVPPGAETHSVLVTDIPGIPYGTIIDRLAGSFLMKLVPQKVKNKAAAKVAALKRSPTQLMKRFSGDAGTGRYPAKANSVARFNVVEPYGTDENNNSEFETHSSSPASSSAPTESAALFTQQQQEAQENVFRYSEVDRWDEAVQYLNAGFTVPELVEEKFRQIHDGDVAAVQVVRNTSSLDALVASYDSLTNEAASAVDTAVTQYKNGKQVKIVRKVVVGATLGSWGREKYGLKPVKIDAFEFYR